MTSEDIIRFRNDIVVTADIFTLLCGAEIGEGIGRKALDQNNITNCFSVNSDYVFTNSY